MCVTNSDCQAGFRCDSESGQCVPANSSGDPIKPGTTTLTSEDETEQDEPVKES